jgi:hypothetical protein
MGNGQDALGAVHSHGCAGALGEADIGARATTVLPKLEQLGYLVQTEARIPGPADEAQRMPPSLSP